VILYQKDVQGIARRAEMSLLLLWFVRPPETWTPRGLTHSRLQLVRDRTREWQRLGVPRQMSARCDGMQLRLNLDGAELGWCGRYLMEPARPALDPGIDG
jgi:hypothetical protein